MRITDPLKDRGMARIVLDVSDPKYVAGAEEERAKARREWHQARFTHEVLSSKLPEIPRFRLQPVRGLRHTLEDTEARDGDFYVVYRGTSVDLSFAENIAAYYVDADGVPVLLERPSGVKSRAELEQLRAERRRVNRTRRQGTRR